MAKFTCMVVIAIAALQSVALAQFNVLPVFVAESVINEHKEGAIEKEQAELKKNNETDGSPDIVPLHPGLPARLTSGDQNVVETSNGKGSEAAEKSRVKREDIFSKTQVGRVQRSPGRQGDIDSFLSELEKDIRRDQPTRYNANPVNQAPSWSYKSPTTTERSFWKKFGDSISSSYSQAKNKAKDIYKGIQVQ